MSDAAITFWLDGALRCVLVFPPNHAELAVQLIDGDLAVITAPCINPDVAVLVAQRLWALYVEGSPSASGCSAAGNGGKPLPRSQSHQQFS
jgi:hypothetical protein